MVPVNEKALLCCLKFVVFRVGRASISTPAEVSVVNSAFRAGIVLTRIMSH